MCFILDETVPPKAYSAGFGETVKSAQFNLPKAYSAGRSARLT
ncbi:MAG: hypothetical protein Q8N45_01085 [Anaerolineales bacterium]|nr:hypothetical protein [Anaerolineales bacterium]